MTHNEKVKSTKRLQKEASILKALASVLQKTVKSTDALLKVSLNRVSLSEDNSCITVYLYSSFGKEIVEKVIKELVAQIAHIRYELAQVLQFRYMPKLFFTYDAHEEKVTELNKKIEEAIQKDKI